VIEFHHLYSSGHEAIYELRLAVSTAVASAIARSCVLIERKVGANAGHLSNRSCVAPFELIVGTG